MWYFVHKKYILAKCKTHLMRLDNRRLIPNWKTAAEKGTLLLVGNISNVDFLEAENYQVNICFESFLSEPTYRNKPETALIPAQSCTVASRTSMLSPQWTSKSASPSSNAMLKLVSYPKQCVNRPLISLVFWSLSFTNFCSKLWVFTICFLSRPQTSQQSLQD